MRRDFGTAFITQCAPVMAGLKPANLFRWVEQDAQAMDAILLSWRAQLSAKGISITVLKACPRTSAFLIYVYREKPLRQILCCGKVQAYLKGCGYPAGSWQRQLKHLSARLCLEGEFPHEIGIFLGYPLEDVEGFVRHKGKTIPVKATGKPMETRKQPELALPATANAPTCICGAISEDFPRSV